MAHVRKIKEWLEASKSAAERMKEMKFMARLRQLLPSAGQELDLVYDNLDWLLKIVEREYLTQRVKALSGLGKGEHP
jgi:hypothetical protein